MRPSKRDRLYRKVIDRLVQSCHEGEGQIGARRARAGIWNPHITAKTDPEQHAVNLLLARLPKKDRETLARLLADQFVTGVHATLAVLHEEAVPPFDQAYEGTPFHDFIGRFGVDLILPFELREFWVQAVG